MLCEICKLLIGSVIRCIGVNVWGRLILGLRGVTDCRSSENIELILLQQATTEGFL